MELCQRWGHCVPPPQQPLPVRFRHTLRLAPRSWHVAGTRSPQRSWTRCRRCARPAGAAAPPPTRPTATVARGRTSRTRSRRSSSCGCACTGRPVWLSRCAARGCVGSVVFVVCCCVGFPFVKKVRARGMAMLPVVAAAAGAPHPVQVRRWLHVLGPVRVAERVHQNPGTPDFRRQRPQGACEPARRSVLSSRMHG